MRAAACLVALVLITTGCDHATHPRSVERPTRVEDLARAPVDLTKGCPRPREHVPQVTNGKLPSGAVLVRLCSGWQRPWIPPSNTPSITPPVDALIHDPDRIVRLANSLHPLPPLQGYCGGWGATAVDLWFGYPGGRAAVGHWQMGDCRGMEFGGTDRGVSGSRRLLQTFAHELDQQRRRADTRSDLRAPGCSTLSGLGNALGYSTAPPWTSATYCVRKGQGPWHSAAIPRAVLRMLSREAATPDPWRECPGHEQSTILARTKYGDLALLGGSACQFTTTLTARDGWHAKELTWRSSPALRHALQRLPLKLAPHHVPPPPPPTVTPQ